VGRNRQPAFGLYARAPRAGLWHATGLLVLTVSGDRICAITHFGSAVLGRFGLPGERQRGYANAAQGCER
jgi:RNA polymerase sigma-70 factor (ECF subfamily)